LAISHPLVSPPQSFFIHDGAARAKRGSPPTTPRGVRRIYRRICRQHNALVSEAQKHLQATKNEEDATNELVVRLEMAINLANNQLEDLQALLEKRRLRRSPRNKIKPEIQPSGSSVSDSEFDY
jgi:hypothetical protein